MLSKGVNLVIISMLVFGVLNLVENIIHYNIGRSYNKEDGFVLVFPTNQDLMSIIFVMVIFGLAQGIITELIVKD